MSSEDCLRESSGSLRNVGWTMAPVRPGYPIGRMCSPSGHRPPAGPLAIARAADAMCIGSPFRRWPTHRCPRARNDGRGGAAAPPVRQAAVAAGGATSAARSGSLQFRPTQTHDAPAGDDIHQAHPKTIRQLVWPDHDSPGTQGWRRWAAPRHHDRAPVGRSLSHPG